MKNKIMYFVIIITLSVLCMIPSKETVKAYDVEPNFDTGDSGGSSSCNTQACANSENIVDGITGIIYGLRISVVDSTGKGTVKNAKNFWATESMYDFFKNSKSYSDNNNPSQLKISKWGGGMSSYKTKYVKGIFSEIGYTLPQKAYSEFKESLSESNGKVLEIILNEFGITPKEAIESNYWLKVEPIYALHEKFYMHNIFYFGTSSEIMTSMDSMTKRACSDSRSCSYGSAFYDGGCIGDVGSDWNVVRNFIVSIYTPCDSLKPSGVPCYGGNVSYYKSFINNGECINNAKNLVEGYKKSDDGFLGLGVGYIKISDYIKKTYVKITKTDNQGNTITNPKATFNFKLFKINDYDGSKQQIKNFTYYDKRDDNPKTSTADGVIVFNNSQSSIIIELPIGHYYLEEQDPDPDSKYYYYVHDKNGNKYVDFRVESYHSLDNPKDVKIKNYTECEYRRDVILANYSQLTIDRKRALIELYEDLLGRKYSEGSIDYRGLLDFSNPKCETVNNVYSSTIGCLKGRINGIFKGEEDITESSFNSDNISAYTEKDSKDGNKVYCQTTYSLDNKLGTSSFKSKAGRMPIQKLTLDEAVATEGTLTIKCFVLNENTYNKTYDYKDYVKSVKFNNDPLPVRDGKKLKEFGSTDTKFTLNKDSDNFYKGEKAIDFYLNPIYLHVGNGKSLIKQEMINDSKYIFAGYGIISKFTSELSDNVIYFNVNYKGEDYSSDACKYDVTRELIIPEDPDNPGDPGDYKLNLEFRIIDTLNPFPGYDGKGRQVGKNWCGGNIDFDYLSEKILNIFSKIETVDEKSLYDYDKNGDGEVNATDAFYVKQQKGEYCKNINEKVEEFITNRTNSYGRKPSDGTTGKAIYTIELTPDKIKDIRGYNKDNSYDDYDKLKCTDGNDCKSQFLTDYFGIE